MSLPHHYVDVPRLLRVRPGVMEDIGSLLSSAELEFDRPICVSGSGPTRATGAKVAAQLGDGQTPLIWTASEPTIANSLELASVISNERADSVFAVGGGKTIDVAKLAASRARVPLVSVPTSAANDGISSPVASLFDETGHRTSLGATMPIAVLVDIEFIAGAPADTRRAGLGDLISNLVAVADWEIAAERTGEAFDGYSAMIAEQAARAVLALPSVEGPANSSILVRGLVLSGLAMATAGTSRPCSGSEHLISHSLDSLLGREARMHGLQVALGTLIATAAHGRDLNALRSVFERCGLPTKPSDLGLSKDLLTLAVLGAPATRPDRYTVLSGLTPAEVDDIVASTFPE